jgi:DNA-binding CsgD family transcriptional regulator
MRRNNRTGPFGFTPREHQIVALLRSLPPVSPREIAARLFVAESTVADHVKAIYRKTHSNSRFEMVLRVIAADDQAAADEAAAIERERTEDAA